MSVRCKGQLVAQDTTARAQLGGHNWAATWTRVDSDYTEAADLTSWVVRMMSRAKWKDQASQDLWKDQASQAGAYDLS